MRGGTMGRPSDFEASVKMLARAIDMLGEVRTKGQRLAELDSVYEELQQAQQRLTKTWDRAA